MNQNHRTRLSAAICMLGLVVAGCQGEKKTDAVPQISRKEHESITKLLADTAGGMNQTALPAPSLPANLVFTRDDIPREGGYLQVTIGDVNDAESNKFLRRLKTERCTCGCPHTID
ncbi:MAG: hypothetical protein FD129_384, partial [bacterium]